MKTTFVSFVLLYFFRLFLGSVCFKPNWVPSPNKFGKRRISQQFSQR